MQFTPVEDFTSPELQSQYCKGLTYTVKPGNEKLHALAMKWLREGKIVEGAGAQEPTASRAKVTGSGSIN